MKILFVLEHFYPYIGGAEKLFYILATSLVKEGYEVVVVTTRYNNELKREDVHQGVKIIRVDCFNRFGFTFFSLPKILHHAKNANFIHTTTYNAALPAFLAAKFRGKPVFVTFHEVWGNLWKNLPFISFIGKYTFYFFEKMLLKLPFDKFIAVSEFTRQSLMANGISADRIDRIYNGIDYGAFKNYEPLTPSAFTYTFFGRLGVSKGLDLLIPAAAQFSKDHPDSNFKLIIPLQPKGMYSEIKKLIKSFNLESHIELLHNLPREKLYEELLSSSCVVIPSYSEGFCFAAAETIALKIPIISSDRGALKEVVSGKYIKMKEQSVESVTEALQMAFNGNWEESALQHFHLKDSIEKYMKIYY